MAARAVEKVLKVLEVEMRVSNAVKEGETAGELAPTASVEEEAGGRSGRAGRKAGGRERGDRDVHQGARAGAG